MNSLTLPSGAFRSLLLKLRSYRAVTLSAALVTFGLVLALAVVRPLDGALFQGVPPTHTWTVDDDGTLNVQISNNQSPGNFIITNGNTGESVKVYLLDQNNQPVPNVDPITIGPGDTSGLFGVGMNQGMGIEDANPGNQKGSHGSWMRSS